MSKDFTTKLNEKQDYGTGATRDVATGKGRFDLSPALLWTNWPRCMKEVR